MKKLLLFLLFFNTVLVSKSQDAWNYMTGNCVDYHFCVTGTYESDPTEYYLVKAHDTTLFQIMSDSLVCDRLSSDYNDGEILRIIHAGPDGQLMVDLPVGYYWRATTNNTTGTPTYTFNGGYEITR